MCNLNYIQMNLWDMVLNGLDWIHLAQVKDWRRATYEHDNKSPGSVKEEFLDWPIVLSASQEKLYPWSHLVSYFSLLRNITMAIKSRMLRWECHVAVIVETKCKQTFSQKT
jgi:hypothetical protein